MKIAMDAALAASLACFGFFMASPGLSQELTSATQATSGNQCEDIQEPSPLNLDWRADGSTGLDGTDVPAAEGASAGDSKEPGMMDTLKELGTLRCPADKVKELGLCFTPCREGYKGVATTCVPSCPSGYRDAGLHCTKPKPYARGGGFLWKFGDKPFSMDGARARCLAANPQGCEQSGAILLPKCRSGFKASTPVLCTPECPSGFTDLGVACQKGIYDRGVGTLPQPAGMEEW